MIHPRKTDESKPGEQRLAWSFLRWQTRLIPPDSCDDVDGADDGYDVEEEDEDDDD